MNALQRPRQPAVARSLRHGQIPCTRIHARGVVLFVCKSARANPPTAEVETSNLQCRVVCVSVCECVRELERARPPHRTHAQSVERAFTCFRTASRDRGRRRGDRGTPTPSPNPRDVMWRPLEPSVACGFRICCFFSSRTRAPACSLGTIVYSYFAFLGVA